MSSNDPALGAVATADINNMSVATEEMPSLADYGREPSTGAWPDGWYESIILAGYQTQSGKQMVTEDSLASKGDSRNLFVCFQIKNKAGETRNIRANFNYRLPDFTVERLTAIKRVRKQAAAENWKAWPGELSDLQRSSLAVGQLGQFERALGFKLKMIPGVGLNASIFEGHRIDVRLRLNAESGFSDVAEFAKLNERKSLYK
jgi:hypothetical protein